MTSPPPRADSAAELTVKPAARPAGSSPGGIAAGLRRRARKRLDGARSAADARWGRPRGAHQPIYLVAPAGHPNHGDEQILSGWLRYLRHRHPGTPLVVDCHTPGQAAVLHHREHPDVLFADTLWRLVGECPGAEEAISLGRLAMSDLGARPALATGIDLLRSASVVHVIGGGYVNDQWPHHLGVVAAAGEAGRLAGARVVATGQGLMPCSDVDRMADAFRDYALVAVRDTASLDLLATTGVPVRFVGDDGWLSLSSAGARDRAGLTDPASLADQSDAPVYSSDPDTCRDLVLCAQSDLTDPAAVADAVAGVLAAWAVSGERMTVVESIPGVDRVVWDLVCARAAAAGAAAASGTVTDHDDELGRALAALDLPRARFVPFQELWTSGLPARPGQVWLTTRFHPHLFAAARGASGVALHTGSGYYDVKHGSLVAAGSRWPAMELDNGGAPAVPDRGGFDRAIVAARTHAAEGLAGEIYPLR